MFCITWVSYMINKMYLYIFKKQLRWVNFTCNLYKQLMNKDITEMNRVGGVMVNASSGRSWSDQTKDYNIGICCLSAKHAALRSKDKYWLSQNQVNVELSDMYSLGGVEWHVFPRSWVTCIPSEDCCCIRSAL